MINHPQKLIELSELEKTIEKHVISPHVKVELKLKNNPGKHPETSKDFKESYAEINDAGVIFKMHLDNQFFAQVIKRIVDLDEEDYIPIEQDTSEIKVSHEGWEEENSFEEKLIRLRQYLSLRIIEDKYYETMQRINRVMKGLVILHFPNSEHVYGIVSKSYEPTDQLQFREDFINGMVEEHINLDINNPDVTTRYNRIIERFYFDDEEISLSCMLVYGRNNGYGSYYVFWSREIKEIRSLLMPFKSKHGYNFQNNPLLVHLPQTTIHEFVKYVVSEGKKIQDQNRRIVTNRKSELFDEPEAMEIFNKVLDKALVAKASKERCINAFKNNEISTKTLRSSLWAIGASIAYVSTHEIAVPGKMQLVLRKVATALLELGLQQFENTYTTNSFKATFYKYS